MPSKTINVNGFLMDFETPKVMGVINLTPDSFYEGSRMDLTEDVVKRAYQMIDEGADILDVGGYSTRPGADDISEEEESTRVVAAIESIAQAFPEIPISIDTFRVSVAEEAIKAGATMVNDISAGYLDNRMHDFVCEAKVPYIAMHMRGTPKTMTTLNHYSDMVKEVMQYFAELIEKLNRKGLSDVIIDPGFGFAKDVDQNFRLLAEMEHFQILGRPLLAGLSRKSMIYKTLEITPEEALNGTTVLNTLALLKGADILRVHDVKPALEAIKLVKKATSDTSD